MKNRIIKSCLVIGLLFSVGCIEHKIKSDPVEIKPIEVKPIQITIDVNIRVQRELEDIFSFEDKYEKSDPAQQPTQTKE